MARIVECVPNFSEGRDRNVIRQITDAIASVEGIALKDVDAGADMNRVVVTFFGPPEAVAEAAFRGVAKAAEVIDMRAHHGSHPRMGATDVCPFVPVEGVAMADCVALAETVGERVGRELGIPVYLYEKAARTPERRNLAAIRRGEYEGLAAKLADPRWRPDFGPAEFNARAGATVVGAREFLIAYNVNLNSRSKDHATDIAFELREKGRSARRGATGPFYYLGHLVRHEPGRYLCGSCEFEAADAGALFAHTKAAHGYDARALYALNDIAPDHLEDQPVKKPGLFPHCKAIGWDVPQFDRAQISVNLTDFHVTPPHVVLEKARELAAARGLVVTGSEVVGLIPLRALYEAGLFYLRRQGRSAGVPVEDVLHTAVQSMGLRDVAPFDLREKVIGLPEPGSDDLVAKRADAFVHEVSRESPAPGGGSVSAYAGALGAALASMVANLTAGKPGHEPAWEAMFRVAEQAQAAKDALLLAVDEDTRAFNAYMEALRMPKGTPAEKAARKAAMQAGLQKAVAVPLQTAERSLEALALCKAAAETGNRNSASDAGVGAHLARAAVMGACLNVRINLPGIADPAFVAETAARCDELERRSEALLAETHAAVLARIAQPTKP